MWTNQVPIVAQWKWTWLASMGTQVWSLASLSGLRIQHCHDLRCRVKIQLRSGVAVAVAKAGRCSSNSTPSQETSICWGAVLKNKKNVKQLRSSYLSLHLLCCEMKIIMELILNIFLYWKKIYWASPTCQALFKVQKDSTENTDDRDPRR